jgi:DtxR family manganese transport transcriptional regulator
MAKRLGVSHVTVTKTIARLQKAGFVRSEPYRSIFLTSVGDDLARRSEERHRLVVAFLRKLGVNAADAETDAEGIEHHVSEATMSAIRVFVETK